MEKADGAFLTIGELAQQLGVAQHILRYWETRFPQLRPLQRAGNRRYYRPQDVAVAQRIHRLLNVEGFTIKGAAKALTSRDHRGGPAPADQAPAPLIARPQPSRPVLGTEAAHGHEATGNGAATDMLVAEARLADHLIERLQEIREALSHALANGQDSGKV